MVCKNGCVGKYKELFHHHFDAIFQLQRPNWPSTKEWIYMDTYKIYAFPTLFAIVFKIAPQRGSTVEASELKNILNCLHLSAKQLCELSTKF